MESIWFFLFKTYIHRLHLIVYWSFAPLFFLFNFLEEIHCSKSNFFSFKLWKRSFKVAIFFSFWRTFCFSVLICLSFFLIFARNFSLVGDLEHDGILFVVDVSSVWQVQMQIIAVFILRRRVRPRRIVRLKNYSVRQYKHGTHKYFRSFMRLFMRLNSCVETTHELEKLCRIN